MTYGHVHLAGAVNLLFATSQAQVIGTPGRTIDSVGFEIEDLAACVKQLEAKGVYTEINQSYVSY